jgi:hypothetical protein
VWRFRFLAAAIVATGVFAVGAQAGALAVALRYARLLEADRTVTILGRTGAARESVPLLLLHAGFVAALLVVSALLLYFSQTRSLKLRRRYEVFCSDRVMGLVAADPGVRSSEVPVLHDRIVMRLARRDSRYCGRVAEYMVAAIVPAATFVVIIVGLLVIQPALTAGLLMLVGGSLGFQHRASVKGARASVEMEATSPGVSVRYKRAIRWMRGARFAPPSGDWLARNVLGHADIVRHLDAYEARIRLTETTRLISNIVVAAALFAILIAFGISIIESGTGFELLVVYLVALRRAMRDVGAVVQQASALNRFYPMVRRYLSFVSDAQQLDVPELRLPFSAVVDSASAMPGSDGTLSLDRGGIVAVYAPVALNGYSVGAVLGSLLPAEVLSGARSASSFATGDYEPLPGEPPRSSFGLGDLSPDGVCAELEALGFGSEVVDVLPPLDADVDGREWRRVDQWVRFALALRAARVSNRPIVLVGSADMASIPSQRWRDVLASMADTLVLVVYPADDVGRVGRFGETTVAVVDGDRLVGAGSVDWFRSVQAEAEMALLAGPLRDVVAVGPMYEDEEDEEDEEEDDDL